MAAKKLFSLEFEVFGKVQGVFFRKYTQNQAKSLGLCGWCMNTAHGTVKGYAEGKEERLENFKQWLKSEGSPRSIIEKAQFSNMKEIEVNTLQDFSIKR